MTKEQTIVTEKKISDGYSLLGESTSMSKWQFMMDYCKRMGYNPAFSFYWTMAENKWKEVYE